MVLLAVGQDQDEQSDIDVHIYSCRNGAGCDTIFLKIAACWIDLIDESSWVGDS